MLHLWFSSMNISDILLKMSQFFWEWLLLKKLLPINTYITNIIVMAKQTRVFVTVIVIGHCYQKFCDWDLKLLQATQHLSKLLAHFWNGLAFSLIFLILRLVALASNHIALFKRGASEAAEGWLASVAAKLVKSAVEIIILIHARGNKSAAAKFGPKTGKLGAKLLSLKFQHTWAWKKNQRQQNSGLKPVNLVRHF